ncbi:MAG: ABC transporter permease [Gemmatimonadota bacterium]|nr:MAG: ABC transporter permease [Gemmatimonadota bacterium]
MLLRSLQHIGLVLVSVSAAVAIGMPLGVLITRKARLRGPVLAVANVVQTIPSLALFGFLLAVPFIGLGARNAIIALVIYSLLPIIRNTYTGVAGVDPAMREAARGMGMTDRQLLSIVELPLAAPVILAGVRVAAVVAVGIATIAAAVGAGGLGVFIFRGLSMVDNAVIMAGAIPAAGLALLVDGLLHLLERRIDWRVRT